MAAPDDPTVEQHFDAIRRHRPDDERPAGGTDDDGGRGEADDMSVGAHLAAMRRTDNEED